MKVTCSNGKTTFFDISNYISAQKVVDDYVSARSRIVDQLFSTPICKLKR